MAREDFEFSLNISWEPDGTGTVSGSVKPTSGSGGSGPIRPTAANFTVKLDGDDDPVVTADVTPKGGGGGAGPIKPNA